MAVMMESTALAAPLSEKCLAALALAARGFRVFPLVADGKTPAIKAWQDSATTDRATIERWWCGSGSERNIGIATGGNLAVLDIDNKNGVCGSDTLSLLEMLDEGMPSTFTVRTPTGGEHRYFTVTEELRNSASRIGRGLDVRGWHGYVVGPGSTIGGEKYRLAPGVRDIAPLPQWLATKARATPPKLTVVAGDLGPPDEAPDVDRAIDYLRRAEPALEGAGGDAHTYAVACRVKDFGISQQRALDLMLDHWNERCAPPWQPDDLADKVAHAYRYGSSPPGIAKASTDFEPVEVAPKPRRLRWELAEDITATDDTVSLIDGLLDAQAFSTLYGDSNAGKTFVALDLAFHVATGRAWAGRDVAQGSVVYFAAEGGRGIRNRVAALKKHHGASQFPLAVVSGSLKLVGGNSDLADACETVKEVGEALGPVSLIVVDTLARAMSGADENSSVDMGAFIRNVDHLRTSSGAHVMVVHHSGKDTTKGARGHSSLRAAADTELEIADKVLRARKQRDIEYGPPLAFDLAVVELGTNAKGKPQSSCVVEWSAGDAPGDFAEYRPGTSYAVLLGVLREAAARAPKSENATNSDTVFEPAKFPEAEIRKNFISCVEGKNLGSKQQSYREAKKRLSADGVVKISSKIIELSEPAAQIKTRKKTQDS